MSPLMRAFRRQDGTNSEPVPIHAMPFGASRDRLHLVPRLSQPEVAILLSTYNGESFLTAQLHSFLAQTYHAWTLYWRDDGSTDASVRLVRDFAAEAGNERCVFAAGGGSRQITRSFLAVLRAARAGTSAYFAFADQDDVWLPEKLGRGVAALETVPAGQPALYCAQRIVVDSALWRTGEPGPLRRPPGFPAALTQNIAPGCTMMLNRAAADLVLASEPPDTIWHDWWCYVIVAAAGGRILADPTATVLYRQHANNHIGESRNWLRRGIAALRRGPGPFMRLLRQHVTTLQARPELLPASTHQQLSAIADALNGGRIARIRVLCLPGFARQTWLETWVFRVWFLLG
jgi:glycosyltransferase involved in cell wall biosynthesis